MNGSQLIFLAGVTSGCCFVFLRVAGARNARLCSGGTKGAVPRHQDQGQDEAVAEPETRRAVDGGIVSLVMDAFLV